MTEKQSLFRKESLERMQSPEKIDEYIRVSSPKAWILVAALALIVVGVLVWGFIGSVPKTVTANGGIFSGTFEGKTYDEDAVILLPLDEGGQYLMGHEASVTRADGTSIPGTVIYVREDPYSYEEIQELTRSDWRFQTLWGDGDGMYRYGIAIGLDQSAKDQNSFKDGELVSVTVVMSDVKPIEYMLN